MIVGVINRLGLDAESVVARVHASGLAPKILSAWPSVWMGAAGFGLASVTVFTTVATAEKWLYAHLGIAGAYALWIFLFLAVGGGFLGQLVIGPGRLGRFYLLFSLAFLLYAGGWIAAYFSVRNVMGEWLGSAAGTSLLGLTFAAGFSVSKKAPLVILILFASNSAGYFLGKLLYQFVDRPYGMILWGVVFGWLFGGGLGCAIYLCQERLRQRLYGVGS